MREAPRRRRLDTPLTAPARRTLLPFVLLLSACGFGTYDDSANPSVISSNSGVPDAGPWWGWVCPNGSNPAAASAPAQYAAAGSCGDGGVFSLGVSGCEIQGDWSELGLNDVSTLTPSSIPGAGGWEVEGTHGPPDGGAAWTCQATAAASGVVTVSCGVPDAGAPSCVTTLSPVGAP